MLQVSGGIEHIFKEFIEARKRTLYCPYMQLTIKKIHRRWVATERCRRNPDSRNVVNVVNVVNVGHSEVKITIGITTIVGCVLKITKTN